MNTLQCSAIQVAALEGLFVQFWFENQNLENIFGGYFLSNHYTENFVIKCQDAVKI